MADWEKDVVQCNMGRAMKKLNIDKIAKLALVSRSVVSRVLNNHPNVSEQARGRVLKVVEEYNYTPNPVARSLATQHTRQIGVLSSRFKDENLDNGYWSQLYLGAFEESIRRGYYVRLSFYDSSMDDNLLRHLLNVHQLDGLICLNEEVTDLAAEHFAHKKSSMVIVGHNPKYTNICSVDVDNRAGAHKGVSHLTGLGHQVIGGIFGNHNIQETEQRISGYKEALEQAGIEFNEQMIHVGSYSQEEGYKMVNEWLASAPDMTALFCAGDTIAMGALLALKENNISVPQRFSVVGFDGLPISKYLIPPLTTVAQPIYGKGEKAAALLIDQIQKKETRTLHVDLMPELIIRKSTAPLLSTGS